MIQTKLKPARVILAILFFLPITFLFVDFKEFVPTKWTSYILYLQFIPSFLKFLGIVSLASAGFIFILLLTLLFGRIYCSAICPLGIFQDVISRLANRIKKKHRYRYKKPQHILRYSILGVTLIVFLIGSVFLLNLLDPYSIFGRIASDLFRPVAVAINNGIAALIENFDFYFLDRIRYIRAHTITLVIPVLFLIGITALAYYRGRLYCNIICPVGTLLGLVSKISLFRIKIDNSCTQCGKCMFACKAECIDVKQMTIDDTRCVACFNCIGTCATNSIAYRWVSGKQKTDFVEEKRNFIAKSLLYGIALVGIRKSLYANTPSKKKENVPIHKNHPVSPPGSGNIDHFKDKCTACHLCVTVCPTGVLQPSFLEYGFTGMMQPHMDYSTEYCNYECTKCGEVCPTGAILPLTQEEKKTTQIGRVHFIIENCVVYTNEEACGSCSEHCPTQAVTMVPYKDHLTIPEIRPEICVGCGACEYACPVRPHKAIYVDGNAIHQEAQKPVIEKLEIDTQEEFPF